MCNQAQVLLKRSCALGEACKYTDKGNYVAMYRKNNICISCVFNGFKYRCKAFHRRINTLCITDFYMGMSTGVSLLRTVQSLLTCRSKLSLWESIIVLYFVVRYFMSILVLLSS